MNFSLVGSLLAVGSTHDTVHIFKLGNREKVPSGSGSGSSLSSSAISGKSGAISPPETLDGQQSLQRLDGGNSVFVEKKKSSNIS